MLIALRYGTVQANQGPASSSNTSSLLSLVGACSPAVRVGDRCRARLGDHGDVGRSVSVQHHEVEPTVALPSSEACCCSPFWSTTTSARRLRRHDDAPTTCANVSSATSASTSATSPRWRTSHAGGGRQGHVRARRQRCRQVDVHQDPVGRAPAELGRVPACTATRSTSSRPEARNAGIATVFQDLALAPLMSIWRNFFLGVEPMQCFGRSYAQCVRKRTAKEEMPRWASTCATSTSRSVRCRAASASRWPSPSAVYFGARVLILDEPTSALGVKQSGVVLKYTRAAAERGLGVIFITHNPTRPRDIRSVIASWCSTADTVSATSPRTRSPASRAHPLDGRRRGAGRNSSTRSVSAGAR